MTIPKDQQALRVRDLSKSYGDHRVLTDINLTFERGSITALLGPSGCGKTTLLNAILGTGLATTGYACVVDKNGYLSQVRGPGSNRGIVYQSYPLFPHMTALENVEFGEINKLSWRDYFRRGRGREWVKAQKAEIRQKATELLESMGLAGKVDLYPDQLSGGQRQRVAIAQAIITEPDVLLMDEPFGALDENTKGDLHQILLSLKERGITVLFVTHNIKEAIFVADRVLVLSQYYGDQQEKQVPPNSGARIVYDQLAPVFGVGDEMPDMSEHEGLIDLIKVMLSSSNSLPPEVHAGN